MSSGGYVHQRVSANNVILEPTEEEEAILGSENMYHSYSVLDKEKRRYGYESSREIPVDKMGFSTVKED